jgi:uncharacterized membrane protein
MVNQRENLARERGGISVRDYTQGVGSSSLRRRLQEDGMRGVMEKVNFNKIARALVWGSLGLGLAQVLAPKRVQRLAGVRCGDHSQIIRGAGFREIGHALLILLRGRPTTGVISRIAGDAMDLGLLGAAFTTPGVKKGRLAATTASVLGITALDVLTASQLRRQEAETRDQSALTRSDLKGRAKNGAFHVTKSITINRSPEELYQFWRDFENLPHFMVHLEEVRAMNDRRSHWVVKAPAGARVSWDAEITEDQPNRRIAWQSLPEADVPNSGQVHFKPAPAGRGTVVRVEIEYRPPGGALGKTVAKLFGEEPGQQVADDLRRFKQVMETGEVVRSDGSPRGAGQKIPRPAQPVKREKRDQLPYSTPNRASMREE